MKCSDCGQPVAPVVVFDIDGTMGDYHTHFIRFCVMYFNRPFPMGYDGGVDFEDYLCLNRNDYRAAKLAYRQGGTKRWMPPYPDGVGAARVCVAAGAELWICTTRPWQRLDSIDPDTREWIRRQGLDVRGLLFGDDKYDQLLERMHPERVIGIVEDLPEQYDYATLNLGLTVYQPVRRHNAHPTSQRPGRTAMSNIAIELVEGIKNWTQKEG